ncbi:autotransporter domain-containing protein [Chelativorans alearense]|uniref:autotransporter domain-containing protein n=1 Tax=Chelativorans alearense TaxID=2681495 RepID=UPI0013CFEB89|nr:autotransporter domain-containing protein [Chelativorans alearense]
MKRIHLVAGLFAMVCQSALAADIDGGPPSLPLGVQAQINLDRAGLLWNIYSNDQYGTVQARSADARATYTTAALPGPTSGYEDANSMFIPGLNVVKALPGGESYLRFQLRGATKDAASNLVEVDGGVGEFLVTYQRFPTVNSMYAIGAFVEGADLDIAGLGNVKRTGYGVRLDGAYVFSDHWGVAGRARYSLGESKLRAPIPFPPGMLTRDQGNDIFYTQVDFVGQFRNNDLGWIPEGWVLHPIIGGQYQYTSIETVTDNLNTTMAGVNGSTEEYGTAWVKMQFQKEVPPGHWAPNVTLGLEQEWVNSLNAYVDEPTFGFVELGLSKMWQNGTRVDFVYGRHQSLNGNRSSQSLVTSISLNF